MSTIVLWSKNGIFDNVRSIIPKCDGGTRSFNDQQRSGWKRSFYDHKTESLNTIVQRLPNGTVENDRSSIYKIGLLKTVFQWSYKSLFKKTHTKAILANFHYLMFLTAEITVVLKSKNVLYKIFNKCEKESLVNRIIWL